MSYEMKFRDEKFKEFWHSWKGTAKENDEHFKAEIYSSWCHSWSRALASQPKGREWWMREVPDGDAYIKWQVFGPGVLLDTIKKKNHDTFIHIREVLASQAADEGKDEDWYALRSAQADVKRLSGLLSESDGRIAGLQEALEVYAQKYGKEAIEVDDVLKPRIAKLEAANENLKMLIRRVYRKLKIARPGSAIDLLDEAFDLWKGSILRGSDGGGG